MSKDKISTYYVDYTHISYNYVGVQVVFSTIGRTERGKEEIEAQVSVGMSPEHAMQLYILIGKHLQEYEEKFGPIRPVPG